MRFTIHPYLGIIMNVLFVKNILTLVEQMYALYVGKILIKKAI